MTVHAVEENCPSLHVDPRCRRLGIHDARRYQEHVPWYEDVSVPETEIARGWEKVMALCLSLSLSLSPTRILIVHSFRLLLVPSPSSYIVSSRGTLVSVVDYLQIGLSRAEGNQSVNGNQCRRSLAFIYGTLNAMVKRSLLSKEICNRGGGL